MNTELAFLCDSALEDRGKLHALGIGIDGVQGNVLPMTHPRFVVVCVMRYSVVEAGDKRMEIRLLGPDAQDVLTPVERVITLPARSSVVDANARIIAEVNSVTFHQAGPHAFHVVIDGNEVARLPINVSLRAS